MLQFLLPVGTQMMNNQAPFCGNNIIFSHFVSPMQHVQMETHITLKRCHFYDWPLVGSVQGRHLIKAQDYSVNKLKPVGTL